MTKKPQLCNYFLSCFPAFQTVKEHCLYMSYKALMLLYKHWKKNEPAEGKYDLGQGPREHQGCERRKVTSNIVQLEHHPDNRIYTVLI